MKRLGKSTTNRVISGVCGGLGEYFNIDPSIVRIIWAAATFFGVGSPILIYIVCAVVLPYGTNAPDHNDHYDHNQN